MNKILLTVFTLAAAGALSLGEEAAKAYPLETCVVSGEKLGSMGKPLVLEHEGKQVQFCCKSCLPKFKKDPAKYMKKLDEAKS